jgi:hypothetical protein
MVTLLTCVIRIFSPLPRSFMILTAKKEVETCKFPYKNANGFNPTKAKCFNNKSLTRQTMTKVKHLFFFTSF